MTKAEKGTMIINGLKELRASRKYGGYRYSSEMCEVIASVMGYRMVEAYPGRRFSTVQEKLNVEEIIRRMEAKEIIKMSKSRRMFKLLV